MTDGCDECEMWRQKGAAFCPACGRSLEKQERPLIDTFILLGVTAVAFIILANSFYAVINFGNIYDELSGYKLAVRLSFGLWDMELLRYGSIWIGIYLAVLILVETACVVYGSWRLWTVLKERQTDYHAQATTGIAAATAALAASLFISILGVVLTAAIEQAPNTDWMNDFTEYEMVFLLTRAGVSEELMYRVLYIGVPMMILALIVRRDKRSWQYLFGGFGISKTAAILILFSSVLFGLAHYDGWGWSKIPITFAGGILFGYVYSEYGLYACIIMHTANDVMTTLAYLGLPFLTLVAEFSLIGLGLLVLLHWILHPNRELLDIKNMENFPQKLERNLKEQWERH